MKTNNRIERLTTILSLLSKGESLSTPYLVDRFKTTKKIIQTDFKEYLLPLYQDETIFYDYSSKTYKAKNNFITKTLFSANELAVIAILKTKSKDKYSDNDLFDKTNALFEKFEDELSNKVYQKSCVENIDSFKDEIIQIKNAIETKHIIECNYLGKQRRLYPLKILNLEGYWYLIVHEPQDPNKIKTFHLNSIKDIKILNEYYTHDEDIVNKFDNAITAYYKVQNNPIAVQLFIEKEVARFFIRKPLSQQQRIIKTYQDGSLDLEITITDYMEIIPTIQRYIPYVKVIEPQELKDKISENIRKYMDN